MAAPEAVATLERALVLRRIAGLEALDAELLTLLAAHAEVRALQAGATLGGGERPAALRFVIAGRVRDAAGVHGPGSLLAADAGGRGGDGLALEESLTLTLELDGLTELCEEHFGMLLAVTRGLARSRLARWQGNPPSADAPAAPRALICGDLVGLGDRIAFLARCPAFAGVPVHAVGQLAQGAQELALRAGERLWSAGDPSGSLVAVVDGRLDARAQRGDFSVSPGALAGLIESLAGEPRWYTATAREPVRVLKIDVGSVFDVAEDDPETAAHLLAALARSWGLAQAVAS